MVLPKSDIRVPIGGNRYFPRSSVATELFSKSETPYTSPWKGVATYWNVSVDGKEAIDIAKSYDDPSEAAEKIKEHFAFDTAQVELVE